jgi:hypothetical protein
MGFELQLIYLHAPKVHTFTQSSFIFLESVERTVVKMEDAAPEIPEDETPCAAPTTEEKKKPAKKRGGSRPILKVSGISKVDNNMKVTTFVPLAAINQKNYYT